MQGGSVSGSERGRSRRENAGMSSEIEVRNFQAENLRDPESS